MRERGRDLLLVEPRAVIALDQQSDASAGIDVPRPAERLVEHAEFLEQIAILLQRQDRLRAARPGIDAIGHDRISYYTPALHHPRNIVGKCAIRVLTDRPRQVDASG